jgi:hypothetical protein
MVSPLLPILQEKVSYERISTEDLCPLCKKVTEEGERDTIEGWSSDNDFESQYQ